MNLFEYAERYPHSPGFKKRDTAKKAAREMKPKAPTLRDACLKVLRQRGTGMTADEIAAELGKSVLSIRPRVSELAALGSLEDTGLRRDNRSMKQAIVWRAKHEKDNP